jgi:hypothetical protein
MGLVTGGVIIEAKKLSEKWMMEEIPWPSG